MPFLSRGRFITFEGGEGAGKTTLIKEVERHLLSEGYSVVKTREPGGTEFGEQIRNLLLSHSKGQPLSPYAELSLFLAARAQHIQEVIVPALENQKVVLCDRFNDSTIAYQGVARGLGRNKVAEFCEFVCQGITPHLTLYLDLDPALGLHRARQGSPQVAGARGYDRIESEGLMFHAKIREAFREEQARAPHRFHLLDASQSSKQVFEEAMKLIHHLLGSA